MLSIGCSGRVQVTGVATKSTELFDERRLIIMELFLKHMKAGNSDKVILNSERRHHLSEIKYTTIFNYARYSSHVCAGVYKKFGRDVARIKDEISENEYICRSLFLVRQE